MFPYIHLIIPSYGLLSLIGGIVAISYVQFNSEKEGVLFTEVLQAVLFGGIGLFIGSKILYAITHIPWLIKNFSVVNMLLLIPQSGYVFYGGLFGFIFALCIMCRGKEEYKKKLLRLFTPAFPLFHMFGRIGCFMSGCCYGKELNAPIVISIVQFDRIPIQLIESVMELVIFILLCVIKKKNQEKELLPVYLVSYAIVRFVLEFFRGDVIRGVFAGLSTSQYISISIIVFYVVRKIIGKNKYRKRLLNIMY